MLSQTARSALRALVVIAGRDGDAPVLGSELAASSGVPPGYLAKILLELKRAGLVSATRGRRGGYRLTRPAAELPLFEVVALFDPARAVPGCLLGVGRPCRDDAPCPAHASWRAVRATIERFLADTTLADIACPDHSLGAGLDREP